MYSVAGYASMIADRRRMDAYEQAIARAVTPGSVVVDIGTGTAIMAMIACRYGAARVYAIEPAPIVETARQIVSANSLDDRITVIEGISTKVTLPERADVVVSDLRGVLPWFNGNIHSIADARERMLKPGGHLIPVRDTLRIALVSNRDLWTRAVEHDLQSAFVLAPLHRLLRNSWSRRTLSRSNVMCEPQEVAVLDYGTESSPALSAEVKLLPQAGIAHGFVLWFDSLLIDGVTLTNAPGEEELIYGQAFFPFAEELHVGAGQAVTVHLDARPVDDDYVWVWKTGVDLPYGRRSFTQSTFHGTPIPRERLHRHADNAKCSLSEAGALKREILLRMDGTRTNSEIAQELAASGGDARQILDEVTAIAGELGVAADRLT